MAAWSCTAQTHATAGHVSSFFFFLPTCPSQPGPPTLCPLLDSKSKAHIGRPFSMRSQITACTHLMWSCGTPWMPLELASCCAHTCAQLHPTPPPSCLLAHSFHFLQCLMLNMPFLCKSREMGNFFHSSSESTVIPGLIP